MTILTLHEKECCKIAEEILNKEIQNPITAEVSTDSKYHLWSYLF